MKTSFQPLLLLIILLLLGCEPMSQSIDKAAVANTYNVVIGPTTSIPTSLSGLPVVEPHISAHPMNNDHLLVAAMIVTDRDNPYTSCRLVSFVSKDGGRAWTETVHDWWGYDPWTSILPSGEAAMTWIGNKGNFEDYYPIRFFNSNDGGMSWSDEVQTLEGNHDGTKLTAGHNRFFFTTVQFKENMGTDVVLMEKQPGGAFAEVSRVDGKTSRLDFCEPALTIDGSVLVPYTQNASRVWVRKFDHENLESTTLVSIHPGGSRGYSRMVSDTVTSSLFYGRVYHGRATPNGLILNYSSDVGKTWSKDKRVDLFTNNVPSKSLIISLAVNNEGVLGISWVDSYDRATQNTFDTYFTFSLDGGESFQRPIRITSEGTDPKTALNADVANKFTGGGHYMGLTSRVDGSFQLVWSDSRSGLFELQTCNVRLK
ncbi:MAG: hypothetical protein AB7O48_19420 [Cyclobacteriaceae bacterium]